MSPPSEDDALRALETLTVRLLGDAPSARIGRVMARLTERLHSGKNAPPVGWTPYVNTIPHHDLRAGT